MEIRDLFELENDTAFQQLNQQVNSFNTLKILKLEFEYFIVAAKSEGKSWVT